MPLDDADKEFIKNLLEENNSATDTRVAGMVTRMIKKIQSQPVADHDPEPNEGEIKDPAARALYLRMKKELDEARDEKAENSKKEALSKALELAGVGHPSALRFIMSDVGSKIQLLEGDYLVGEQTLTEYVSSWAKTDEGKLFRPGPAGSGTGARPGQGGPARERPEGSKIPEGKQTIGEKLSSMLEAS